MLNVENKNRCFAKAKCVTKIKKCERHRGFSSSTKQYHTERWGDRTGMNQNLTSIMLQYVTNCMWNIR